MKATPVPLFSISSVLVSSFWFHGRQASFPGLAGRRSRFGSTMKGKRLEKPLFVLMNYPLRNIYPKSARKKTTLPFLSEFGVNFGKRKP
jgi:hypothetical protein